MNSFWSNDGWTATWADQLELEVFVVGVVVVISVDERFCEIDHDIVQVDLDPLAVERMAPTGIYHLALGVHHVIVFEQPLADAEVVFLNLALRAFDRLGHHAGLNDFSLLETHAVHQTGDPFRAEQPHQVVLERYEELRRARSP